MLLDSIRHQRLIQAWRLSLPIKDTFSDTHFLQIMLEEDYFRLDYKLATLPASRTM